jgi:hypothetical protein
MSKRRKAVAQKITYHLVQVDDDGERVIGTGFSSPRTAASSIAGVHEWLDVEAIATLATTWNACAPSGGERFMIGQDE